MILKKLVTWSRVKSPWLIHYDTGGCNACDIEVLAALTPRFDLERFGILHKGSPRHADILIVTGALNRHTRARLERIYAQMPNPKFVIAVGTCACSGGVYHSCYNVYHGVDKAIPVDVYIPGCPPRPENIIYGVIKLLEKIKKGGEK